MNTLNRIIIAAAFVLIYSQNSAAQINLFGKASDEVNKKVGESIDDALHPKPKEEPKKPDQPATPQTATTTNTTTATAASADNISSAQTISAYQNFDFKAGDSIVFEDNFTGDEDGEFPAHWDLNRGQGVVNAVGGAPAFLLTEGNYVMVTPRMTTDKYLSDPFTIEFDFIQVSGAYSPIIRFHDSKGATHDLHFGQTVETSYFVKDFSGSQTMDNTAYAGKWHHAAMTYKKDQLKAYVDNVRALVVPHCDFVPVSIEVGGIGDQHAPITFRNFRMALGGSQNMIGNILTAGRFVTHGITFDIGKATLKPESMGVLNDVVKFMTANSTVSMEIDGHTDNDGNAAQNQKLSEDRAASVKTQLVAMGVGASRLSTKGFGSAKPLVPNDTPEDKANNRRVEFIKM